MSKHASLAFRDFMYISSIYLYFLKVELIVFKVPSYILRSLIESSYFLSDIEILSIAFYRFDSLLKTY